MTPKRGKRRGVVFFMTWQFSMVISYFESLYLKNNTTLGRTVFDIIQVDCEEKQSNSQKFCKIQS